MVSASIRALGRLQAALRQGSCYRFCARHSAHAHRCVGHAQQLWYVLGSLMSFMIFYSPEHVHRITKIFPGHLLYKESTSHQNSPRSFERTLKGRDRIDQRNLVRPVMVAACDVPFGRFLPMQPCPWRPADALGECIQHTLQTATRTAGVEGSSPRSSLLLWSENSHTCAKRVPAHRFAPSLLSGCVALRPGAPGDAPAARE